MVSTSRLGWLSLTGAVVVGVAAQLRWATVFGHDENGLARNGRVTLACAVVMAVAGLLIGIGRRRRVLPAVVFAASVVTMGVTLADIHDVTSIPRQAGLPPDVATVGVGATLTLWAGLACLLIGAVALMLPRR